MFGISRAMMLVCLTAAVNCATIGYEASMMSSLNILVRILALQTTPRSVI
jgi:hypothetical protein